MVETLGAGSQSFVPLADLGSGGKGGESSRGVSLPGKRSAMTLTTFHRLSPKR
jgi:hypothetical protein